MAKYCYTNNQDEDTSHSILMSNNSLEIQTKIVVHRFELVVKWKIN